MSKYKIFLIFFSYFFFIHGFHSISSFINDSKASILNLNSTFPISFNKDDFNNFLFDVILEIKENSNEDIILKYQMLYLETHGR
jgi:hypothetical protein